MALQHLSRDDACFLTYSVSCRHTFETIQHFVAAYEEHGSQESEESSSGVRPRLFVVATKIDLDPSLWEVFLEEGRQYSERIGAMFLQVSSKEDSGTTKDDVSQWIEEILLHRALNAKSSEEAASPIAEIETCNPARQSSMKRAAGSLLRCLRQRSSHKT